MIPIAQHAATAADNLLSIAGLCRARAVQYIAQCDAGAINVREVAEHLMQQIGTLKTQWAALIVVQGVGEEIERRYPHKTFDPDIDTELITAGTAMQTLVNFMESNLPKNGQWLNVREISPAGSGQLVDRLVTNGASLANFKSALETFRDAFDAS